MRRLHIVRTRAGSALARSAMASGDVLVAFAPRPPRRGTPGEKGQGRKERGDRAGEETGEEAPLAEIPGAEPEELVHRIFESDVAIVW